MLAETLRAARAILLEGIAEIDAHLAAGSAEPTESVQPAPVEQSAFARAAGFTGDTCKHCGGAAMRRSGTCLTCTDCGSTTGCS